jgi:hypothetical protein
MYDHVYTITISFSIYLKLLRSFLLSLGYAQMNFNFYRSIMFG